MSRFLSCVLALLFFGPMTICAQDAPPTPRGAGTIVGTVVDVNGDVVPGASIHLQQSRSEQIAIANANGFFSFNDVTPGVPCRVIVMAPTFAPWTSEIPPLASGQFYMVTDIRLRLETVRVVVNAKTSEQIATEQIQVEETQRALRIIPNFYVAYNPNSEPLTAKLKFRLAFRLLLDPATIGGFGLNAGIYQMTHYPDYQEGLKGFGQRLGATFAGGYANLLIGDAVLASLLHQDPRYFYQGTGSARSRWLHALSNAFVTRGDNGHNEFNYSDILGSLASGAVANAYYPSQDRGLGLVWHSALIGIAGRTINGVFQEFVLRKVTKARGEPIAVSSTDQSLVR
ncbi:MAG TPA: carboxypeptidase-like regulatory domain-containing protein [Acidobacteriaceae bacterium]|nr:carboxypeptidase-like regulatory domain-containing protein [Acidobacteriaceae bacterium]